MPGHLLRWKQVIIYCQMSILISLLKIYFPVDGSEVESMCVEDHIESLIENTAAVSINETLNLYNT